MSPERDTWPPRLGQRVIVKATNNGATVMGHLPGGRLMIETDLIAQDVGPGGLREIQPDGDRLEEVALDEIRPEYPHLVTEWRGSLE